MIQFEADRVTVVMHIVSQSIHILAQEVSQSQHLLATDFTDALLTVVAGEIERTATAGAAA